VSVTVASIEENGGEIERKWERGREVRDKGVVTPLFIIIIILPL